VLWLKDPYNLGFLVIILAAIIIRLYYFFLTKNQPLWWDEAEYGLRAKAFAFNTPLSGWAPERELVVPFLYSLLFRIGLGEVGMHFFQLLISLAAVGLTYFVFSRILSKKTGLIACFGMAFFWLHIFFTQRILVYLWAPVLFLLIVYFFYTGYIKESKRQLYIFAVISSIGLQTYFSVGFLLFGLFLIILFKEKLGFFKNKNLWKAFGIFILVLLPYMILSQINYGFPLPRFAVGLTAASEEAGAGISGIFAYLQMFPSRVGFVFVLLSSIGILYFLFDFILGLGIKEYAEKNLPRLLVFSGFFIPLFFYTLYGVVGGSGTFYDAFILPIFPFFFAFAGFLVEKSWSLKKEYRKIAAIILILLLAFHAFYGIKNSELTIKPKISSYDAVKYAGIWIKENSSPGDIVVSRSKPQNTYYSERETLGWPETQEELEQLIVKEKPKYLVDSMFESRKDYADNFIKSYSERLIPVRVYYLDSAQTQPSLIIYELKY
jgi:hypothetical protein